MEMLFGINTVKISSAEGIGFAIPINVVKPVIESFIKKGSFEQATMGAYVYDKDVIPYLNSNLNFNSGLNSNFNRGIYVAQIIKNGPASKTELKEGDIITSIDGKEINTMNELREYIYAKKPNDIVTLQVSRGKINKTISVELRQKMRRVRQIWTVSLVSFFEIIFSYIIFCFRIIHKNRRTVLH